MAWDCSAIGCGAAWQSESRQGGLGARGARPGRRRADGRCPSTKFGYRAKLSWLGIPAASRRQRLSSLASVEDTNGSGGNSGQESEYRQPDEVDQSAPVLSICSIVWGPPPANGLPGCPIETGISERMITCPNNKKPRQCEAFWDRLKRPCVSGSGTRCPRYFALITAKDILSSGPRPKTATRCRPRPDNLWNRLLHRLPEIAVRLVHVLRTPCKIQSL